MSAHEKFQKHAILTTKRSRGHRKAVMGIGLNDAPYNVSNVINGVRYTCPVYQKWQAMLQRANGKTCVDKSWLTFSIFSTWMTSQPHWEERRLDRMIKAGEGSGYGPATCLMISKSMAGVFSNTGRRSSCLPKGVAAGKSGKFTAGITIKGRHLSLGTFSTLEEAVKAYQVGKNKVVEQLAEVEKSPSVVEALTKWASL